MARVQKRPEEVQKAKAEAEILLEGRAKLGAIGKAKSKKQPKSRSISELKANRYIIEFEERIEQANFEDMDAHAFVAMFCWVYEAVYGTPCVDEIRREWNVAVVSVMKMLEKEFGGKIEEFFEFMIWLSKDEERAELWRRTNQRQGKRLKWREVFMLPTKLADYRIAMLRTKGIA